MGVSGLAGPAIGLRGTITIATRGEDGPGEVELSIEGGSETFIAYSDDPLPRGAMVVVIDVRPSRKVDVALLA
jgi:hypothetical protein